MKRFYVIAAAVPILAMVASAQVSSDERIAKMKAELDAVSSQMRVVGFSGAAMGPTVKGAPYSAVEVSESNQVLADGTRIHNEHRTTVYRDGEGRVRRETPEQITIMDPVAGVSFFLDPKNMTATKTSLTLPMVYRRIADGRGGAGAGADAGPRMTFNREAGENATFEVSVTKGGTTSVTVNGKPVDPSMVAVENHAVTFGGTGSADQAVAMAQDKLKAELAVAGGGVLRNRITAPGKSESLGTQMMEGVNAEGTRLSTTLEAGTIGNDRPIQMVNERWYSPELKMVVMTRHSDPRTGEDIFRLTNVTRTEPGSDLFQVPTSYQIQERK